MIGTETEKATGRGKTSVLVVSTLGFALMFAVWTMFGVLGIPIRKEFGLTDIQLSWLAAIAVLSGSIGRLAFGIFADRYGGRKMFLFLALAAMIPAYMISQASTYTGLMIWAFLVGIAGNSFSVGIAWNSVWFPAAQQGLALGVFGAGNVGASITKLIGPTLIALIPAAGLAGGFIPGGWRFVPILYCVLLGVLAIAIWLFTPRHDRKPGATRPVIDMLKPLKYVRVWRFSLYYVVVFGAYVALSVWLPKYYVDVYRLSLQTAALLTVLFIFPASLLRPLGGYLSDKYGARPVMYWVFGVMLISSLLLSLGVDVAWFTLLVVIVGVGMGIGKAAVYKYIPDYFPKDVGAVGGLVGMLGALGGFFLPLMFAAMYEKTKIPQTTFLILFLLIAVSFAWLHVTVLGLKKQARLEQQSRTESTESVPTAAS
ncbi:MAG: NarK/NasA family nitrate transporter [Anaerolineae bacterium]|nr:NarK/NasA family nitrate transporter [Anaerolineae bacterium]